MSITLSPNSTPIFGEIPLELKEATIDWLGAGAVELGKVSQEDLWLVAANARRIMERALGDLEVYSKVYPDFTQAAILELGPRIEPGPRYNCDDLDPYYRDIKQ